VDKCNVWIFGRSEDLYLTIESLLNISGRIMKMSSVIPAVRRIFIIWDDGGYDVNDVGEISILLKERDFPAF
jgi:hypothetical protein